jgi:hypothetical protein
MLLFWIFLYLGLFPVLVCSYEYAVYLDAPVWKYSSVLPESAFALFYALRELALLLECGQIDESLQVIGKGDHRAWSGKMKVIGVSRRVPSR